MLQLTAIEYADVGVRRSRCRRHKRRDKRREEREEKETRTARQRRVCGETRDRDAAAKEQLDALDEEAVHEAHDVRERQPLELPAEPLAARGGREVARRLLARAERLIRRRLNIR